MSGSNNSSIMAWLRFVLLISLAWGMLVSVSAHSSPELRVHNKPGTYTFIYKVDDNIFRVERAKLQKSKDGNMNLMIMGAFSYIDDSNKTHIVQYYRNGDKFKQNEVKQLSPELVAVAES